MVRTQVILDTPALISNSLETSQGRATERSKASSTAEDEFQRGPHTVLLIDDDPDQLMLLQFILERQHFRVLAAESTEEAREHLESETISCVVSDVFMPNKSGTEFIAELRNSTEYANLPVILLTAGAKDLEWAALESGADVFCEKKDAKKLLGRQIRLLIN